MLRNQHTKKRFRLHKGTEMWVDKNLSLRELRALLDRAILFNVGLHSIEVKNNKYTAVYNADFKLTDSSTSYLNVRNTCL